MGGTDCAESARRHFPQFSREKRDRPRFRGRKVPAAGGSLGGRQKSCALPLPFWALSVVPGVEQEPKDSEPAPPFDFSAQGQRWRFVDSFERQGVRYVIVSAEAAHGPSVLTLTPRERQVVAEAAAGSSNQQIAQRLGISHATVRVLMARAANRLGVHTRKALLAHPALQAQGSVGAQATLAATLLEEGSLELAEQPVTLPARTGAEK